MLSRIVAVMSQPEPAQLARAREYTMRASAISSLVEGTEEGVAWIELFAGVDPSHGDAVRDWVLTGEGPMPRTQVRVTSKLAQWQAVRAFCQNMGYQ